MNSIAIKTNTISLPLIIGEHSMIPFDLNTFVGIPFEFLSVARNMMKNITHKGGTAFFTIHGKILKANQTLRRGAPHTDGNYEPINMSFGGGGWKIGENGPSINTNLHHRQYNVNNGGIVIASNHPACLGWVGEFEGLPGVGGDCRHVDLDQGFMLQPDSVYYGNNHFIHESLPVDIDVHRVFSRVTMPESHEYS